MVYAQWPTGDETCQFCDEPEPAFCVFKTPVDDNLREAPVDTPACAYHMADAFCEMAIVYGDSSHAEPVGLMSAFREMKGE